MLKRTIHAEMKTIHQLLDTGAEGVSIGRTEFNCETVRPIPLAYVVVLICQQGSAEWDVNFHPYRMEKGDFFVFAEDTVALFKGRSDDFSCNYYLVSRSIAAEIADGLPTSLFIYLSRSPFFRQDRNFLTYQIAWEQQAEEIQKHCTVHKRAMIVNHFRNFFLCICERVGDFGVVESSDFSRPEAICWGFWELVLKNHKCQRSVEFYAGRLHVTSYYLSQLTKRFFGDSPKALIDRQVVLEIKKQLAQRGKSIQKIAEDLRFSDASYLAKYFKRHAGVGMTDYRNRIKS